MPDLTIEIFAQCKQLSKYYYAIGGYSQSFVAGDWECNCPAYTFGKTRPCKHIKELEANRCTWHEAWSDERQTKEQDAAHVCPVCGGETEYVRVGV